MDEKLRQLINEMDRIESLGEDPMNYSDAKSMKTVTGDTITADIVVGEGPDLKTRTPGIGILHNGNEVFRLTWDDARRFAENVTSVADIAEFG